MLLAPLALLLCAAQDAPPLPERLSREFLKKVKAATVFVVVKHGRVEQSGSGFFVSRDGHVVTNRHVVQTQGGSQATRIIVVVNSGLTDQKRYPAKLIRLDDLEDLALLKVNVDDAPALPLGKSSILSEADSVWSFGYPLGKWFAKGERGPGVTVNRGTVSALRRNKEGVLERIQTDAQVNDGNSGGPLVSGDGRVFGVIVARLRGTSLRFAIPSDAVRRFLSIGLDAVEVTPERFNVGGGDVRITAKVVEILKKVDRVWARVIGGGRSERVELTPKENRWTANWNAPPIPAEDRNGISVTLRLKDGKTVTGVWKAKTLTLRHAYGSLAVPSNELVKITLGRGEVRDRVQTVKEVLRGKVELDTWDIGERVAAETILSATFTQREGVRYTITVFAESGEFLTQSPPRDVTVGAVVPKSAVGFPAASFDANIPGGGVRLSLPGVAANAKLAGGGRFLIFHFKELKTLGVFDLKTQEFAKHIPLTDADALFAASRSKLLVCYPKSSVLERWDLTTFDRDLSIETPVAGVVQNLEMGWNSEGPAVIRWSPGRGTSRGGTVDLVDVDTMKVLKVEKKSLPTHWGHSDSMHFRASPDGRTVGIWQSHVSPSGIGLLRLSDEEIAHQREHSSAGYVLPADGGRLLFTSRGLFGSDFRPVGGSPAGPVLPMAGEVFFLSLVSNRNEWKGVVYLQSNMKKILTLKSPILTGFERNAHFQKDDFSFDRRVFVLPSAGMLVAIPSAGDKIDFYPFHLDRLLEEAGVDYLYVGSVPPAVAVVGTEWVYEPKVRSKRGGVELRLDSGPDGMSLDADGVLRWTPAKKMGSVTVILNISDASRQQIYHTFKIRVRNLK